MKSVSASFIWATKGKLQSYQASTPLMGSSGSEGGMSQEFHSVRNFIQLISQTIEKMVPKKNIPPLTPVMLLQYSSKVNWLCSSVLVVLGKQKT